jgi:hypothetical protein
MQESSFIELARSSHHSYTCLSRLFEASSVAIAILLYKNSIITLYLSLIEHRLKIIAIVKVDLARTMRSAVFHLPYIYSCLSENWKSLWVITLFFIFDWKLEYFYVLKWCTLLDKVFIEILYYFASFGKYKLLIIIGYRW